MAVTDRIDAMASPLCDRIGVELLDVEYEGGVLRLVVDHPDGVSMEAIAEVTREVSRAIDHEDPIPGSFTLEVTSPGLERPLKRPPTSSGRSAVRSRSRPSRGSMATVGSPASWRRPT